MDYHKIFLPPVYDSLERSQKAAFLHYTLIISSMALILFGILNFYWGAITLGWLFLGISGLCIVGAILNKINLNNLAALLFSILIFIAIFYNLVDGAALHDPGIAALPIYLILISIFFRRSAIPYFTLVSILGIFAIFFFWRIDLLALSQAPTLNRVIVLTILQVITGIFSWMIVSTQRETSEKLDWSEEKFQALFMAAPIGIGVTTLDGKVLVYNESLIKMGGYTPDEFILLNVKDYYANSEDRIKMLDILKSAGVVRGYETQLLRKDKSVFDVIMSVIPLKYGDEDGLLTIIEDVTERKRTELERQEELEFRRLLLDSSPIFFTVVDEQGKTTMMNKSMLEALGYEWEEAQGAEYLPLFVPEREKQSVLKVIEESFQKSKTTISENHILTKTGQELLVEWHACPIINPEGKIDFIFAYGMDITERKKAEIEIKESAERYRGLIDTMPIPFVIHADEKVLFMNPMGLKTMGITNLEDIIGRSIWNFIHPESEEQAKQNLEITYDQRRATETTFGKFIRLNGEVIDVESVGIPLIYDGQQAAQTVFQDITERKQAERALMESESRNRLILDSLPMAFYRALPYDKYGGTWVSEPIDQIVGFSPDEMVDPEFWSSRLHPDDRDMVLNAFDGLADTNSLEIEYRWQKSDGEYIWIQDNAVLVTDEKGNPKEIIGTWIDVSDRKEAEYAVRESEDRYRTLFDNASDAIFIIRENHVIDCNRSIESMFGYSKEEIIGKHPGEVSPALQPDGQESVLKAETLNRKLKEGSSQLFEWVHQRKDGSEFTAEVKLHQISIQDETLSLAVLRDITERKNAEEAAQEERQRLARDLHDAVSQTLWSASLIADVLPDVWEQDPAQGLDRLERLRQLNRGALAEMRTLLLELRPIALIETNLTELLNQLIEATTSRSGTQISTDIEGDYNLPEDVHVAFYRIAQEALNNATRHALASDIVVRLNCGPKDVRLEIEDNGRGFDIEYTSSGQHLGLNIMRERAFSIGATLDIISRSDEGTQVILIWTQDREVNDG